LRVIKPPERERRQGGRDNEGQQHDGTQEGLDRQVLVKEQREPQAECELHDARDDGVEQGIEERQARDTVSEQEFEILRAHPLAGAPDLGVGKAQPGAQTERVG
jgi:hypothetical protein